MYKVSGFATIVAVALCWIAVSCAGPVTTGSMAAGKGGMPMLASAGAAGIPVAVATVGPTSPWNGSSMFFVFVAMMVGVLGLSMYAFRTKPGIV